MSSRFHTGMRTVAVLMGILAAGCSSGSSVEGKYYNSASGEFALELRGGKVVSMQGQNTGSMTYEVKADSLVIHDPQGITDGMTFSIEKDGSLGLGPFGSLTRKRK